MAPIINRITHHVTGVQPAMSAVESLADKVTPTETGCESKYHNHKGHFANIQNGVDIKRKTEQYNGKFKDFLRCKFNA